MSLEIDGVSGIIKNTTSDGDITIKGNDGGSEISALTFDISAAGAATFNNKIVATELDISGNVDVDGTTNLDVVDIDGAVNMATTALVTGVLTTTATTVFNGGFTSNDGCTITTADNTETLVLKSTDADAAVGPILVLRRDSSSPADDDLLGNIQMEMENSNGSKVDVISVVGQAKDITAGTEDAFLQFNVITAGSLVDVFHISPTETVFNDASVDRNLRIESNGNATMLVVDGENNRVGFGTNPGRDFQFLTTDQTDVSIIAANNQYAQLLFGDPDDDNPGFVSYNNSDNSMQFGTNATEKMRISSTGKIGINLSNTGTAMLKIGIPNAQYGLETLPAVNQTYYAAIFRNSSGNDVGRIESTASATSFVTSSDYRLKENVSYDFDATTRLKQLKPSRFNFINTPDTTVDGFLAHEVSSIVPEAISGTKDATETKEKVVVNANGFVIEEGVEESNWTVGKSDILYTAEDKEVIDSHYNVGDIKTKAIYPADSTWAASKVFPVYQAIDQSKLVPLLVKTIQELEARITTLEG